ncbi:MAG: histidine phosphatase family protein [Chloroflexi bacterium]|nr:histidine phosphatase family protein [Chloroflexota bacterium]
MQLYIIRHAQSVNNAIWAETGRADGRFPDPPLTDLGHQQAIHLAKYLASKQNATAVAANTQDHFSYHLTHLYSSLMLRAVQTAHYIAEALRLPLHAWEVIHEWGGLYENDALTGEPRGLPGPNRAFFAEQFSHLVLPETLNNEGWWNRPFEPPENTPQRAATFVQELLAKHGGTEDRVAIVTHGGFFQALMRHIVGSCEPNMLLNQTTDVWFRVNNTSITRIDFDDASVSIAYLNRLNHLSADIIT